MPSTFAMLDQSLPRFTGEEALEEKVALMEDYLPQLLEQIRWALGHLDLRNMNMDKLNQWAGTITEPIRAELKDQDGNLTQLAATAKGLQAQIKDAQGNITSLQATAQGLSSRVADAERNISTVTQTATGIQSQVTALDGRVSSVQQTAAGLQSTVSNQAGQISSVQQTVNGLTSTVSNQAGQISRVQQTVNGLTVTTPTGQTMIAGGMIDTSTLYVNAANVSGVLNALTVQVTGAFQFGRGDGYIGYFSGVSSGVGVYGPNYEYYCSATATGAKLGRNVVGDPGIWVAGTGCWSSSAIEVWSDRRLKKDISAGLGDREAFFDALRPCAYHLTGEKEGDPLHMGLIAQEVMEAPGAGELAVVGYDGASRRYGLAYGELIPLLIWQVQELKRRVRAQAERSGT